MTSCRFESNHSSTVTLHGGPVVLRPVRATPCFNRMAFGFHVYTICYFLRYDTVYLHALRSKNQVAQKKIVPITIVRKGTTKHSKAPSTPTTTSKQHCRMLQFERFFRHCCRFRQQCRTKFRPFDTIRLCQKDVISFDIVVETGNIIAKKTTTLSKQHSTLSKRQNFTINSFDIVAVFGNEVERCFDIVAGVDRF